MNRKLLYAIMAFAAMTALNSCSDDDFKKVYDEKTSLDSPYIFSEDYKDSILSHFCIYFPSLYNGKGAGGGSTSSSPPTLPKSRYCRSIALDRAMG